MTGRDGDWRRRRLAGARLYLCIDGRGAATPGFLDSVLQAGVDILQLRDKEGGRDDLVRASAVFRAAALAHGVLFVLNDDPELAAEVDADGVHVGQEDPHPDSARKVVGPDRIVGRSTHSTDQFDRGLEEDTDYLAIGPVSATPTKEGRPGIGLDPVRHAAVVADRPWFVTGGMAPDTAPEVLALGANGIVVVRAIVDAPDPARATSDLAALLR
ncbi:MAG: thiamine phosphate synthase [Nitriliruptorales bacterium]